jgi:hypothetical protein
VSTENLILVVLASVACVLNLLFIGPLSASIARLFGRIPSHAPPRQRKGAKGFPPPGPEEPPEMGEAQMSKYR